MSKFERYILSLLSDKKYQKIKGFYKLGYIPNISNPRTFNEHILRNKLEVDSEMYSFYVDRIAVREYVKKRSKECRLIPILWSGEVFTKKVWDSLPHEFVVKANHGSGMVKVVDKSVDEFKIIQSLCQNWLKTDFYKVQREYIYKHVPKTLIVEEKLVFDDGIPPDYKFFCFNGAPKFIQVDYGRFDKHCRNLFDSSFNKLNVKYHYDNKDHYDKPKNFDQAVKIASDLSKDLNFIRVDLYLLHDHIYFGEMTLFPEAGFKRFIPRSFDFLFGKYFNL